MSYIFSPVTGTTTLLLSLWWGCDVRLKALVAHLNCGLCAVCVCKHFCDVCLTCTKVMSTLFNPTSNVSNTLQVQMCMQNVSNFKHSPTQSNWAWKWVCAWTAAKFLVIAGSGPDNEAFMLWMQHRWKCHIPSSTWGEGMRLSLHCVCTGDPSIIFITLYAAEWGIKSLLNRGTTGVLKLEHCSPTSAQKIV